MPFRPSFNRGMRRGPAARPKISIAAALLRAPSGMDANVSAISLRISVVGRSPPLDAFTATPSLPSADPAGSAASLVFSICALSREIVAPNWSAATPDCSAANCRRPNSLIDRPSDMADFPTASADSAPPVASPFSARATAPNAAPAAATLAPTRVKALPTSRRLSLSFAPVSAACFMACWASLMPLPIWPPTPDTWSPALLICLNARSPASPMPFSWS